jgi:phosphoglycolate phosphatase-like HAD superfamily hydrolase
MIQIVLFDLDGTLLDTAHDLVFSLNKLRDERGLPPFLFRLVRPIVSHRAPGLIQLGFRIERSSEEFVPLRQHLLEIYSEHLFCATRPFPGITELLQELSLQGVNVSFGDG